MKTGTLDLRRAVAQCRVVWCIDSTMVNGHVCKICKAKFPSYQDLRGHCISNHKKEYIRIKAWLGPQVVEPDSTDYWYELAKKVEKR